ncbi:hypothetical protein LB504_011447 [Fusarium proliferatum]|nr:hypothetical protein LB504_011447 [Fusarium proliferatum]
MTFNSSSREEIGSDRLDNISQCYFFKCQIHKVQTVKGRTNQVVSHRHGGTQLSSLAMDWISSNYELAMDTINELKQNNQNLEKSNSSGTNGTNQASDLA